MSIARDLASGSGIEAGEVVPHIIPGVLYPAVANIMVDGTTSLSASTTGPNSSTVASSKYGTVQSDGRMYYYTDIKGSKPIKDPRIGGHFGSQRHNCQSLQLLEQETATHGENIKSVDGREWCRTINTVDLDNGSNGLNIQMKNQNNAYIEITGYFSDINVGMMCGSGRTVEYQIDGGTITSNSYGSASVNTPLGSRYVKNSALVNLGVPSSSGSPTLGIHTIKIKQTGGSNQYFYMFELIAQDTSSTANKSKIQIPSQNVVSYGKKFTVSGTPHYDPFNGFTSGTDISGYIDEATSLGMSNWKVSSTWYRPFNGGRVVKWVDSSGNIKTSVTMMPPNAQNIGTTASNAIDLSSSQTNDDTINFNTSAIDHSLSEVAKTFHWREFGNGAANCAPDGASDGVTDNTYADFSMLGTSADDVAYVMDDGLTSFSADDTLIDGTANADFLIQNGKAGYITFIGTGISFIDVGTAEAGIPDGTYSINLPYGTHIFKYLREDTNQDEIYLDGIKIKDPAGTTGGYFGSKEFTFHQPKKPPIPEDAVVIADYMLMADFLKSTNTSARPDDLSKGVRLQSMSRDVFHDKSGGTWDTVCAKPDTVEKAITGLVVSGANFTSATIKFPYFGITEGAVHCRQQGDACDMALTVTNSSGSLESTNVTVLSDRTISGSSNVADLSGSTVYGAFNWQKSDGVLGANIVQMDDANLTGTYDWYYMYAFEVATPIHTSSHYQTFETPFLKELVGGDRNMEQTNLVVTSDGKTWDEVTRDTSYIGNMVLQTGGDTAYQGDGDINIFDEWRGQTVNSNRNNMNKDFAIAYDRMICLKDGYYSISNRTLSYHTTTQDVATIRRNGTSAIPARQSDTMDYETPYNNIILWLNRGDYIQSNGWRYPDIEWTNFYITRC